MSRFRANNSASPIDREVQGQVSAAERAVEAALAALVRARKAETGAARLSPVRRDLERALGSLQSVRRVNLPEAPDFLPTERALHEAISLCARVDEQGDPYARVRRDLERAHASLRGVRPLRAPEPVVAPELEPAWVVEDEPQEGDVIHIEPPEPTAGDDGAP